MFLETYWERPTSLPDVLRITIGTRKLIHSTFSESVVCLCVGLSWGKGFTNSVVCDVGDFDSRVLKEFGNKFSLFAYICEFCPSICIVPFISHFISSTKFPKNRRIVIIVTYSLFYSAVFKLFIGFIQKVCVHSIDHVTYSRVLMFT